MKIIKLVKVMFVATALLASVSFTANAHTILLGTTNTGTPGSVEFWLGTYHQSPAAEGAVSIGSQMSNFANVQAVAVNAFPDPSLVIGDNLFYASASQTYDGLVIGTGCCSSSATTWYWQSAILTGLSAGLNTYTISGMSSVNWADSYSSAANWTGQVFVPSSSINNVSAPGSLAFLGLGLIAVGVARRNKK